MRSLLKAVVILVAFSTLTGGYGIRKDELDCEEAVQRLVDCCPDFVPSNLTCEYTGCGDHPNPDIEITAADCIKAATCDELVENGACENPAQVRCP